MNSTGRLQTQTRCFEPKDDRITIPTRFFLFCSLIPRVVYVQCATLDDIYVYTSDCSEKSTHSERFPCAQGLILINQCPKKFFRYKNCFICRKMFSLGSVRYAANKCWINHKATSLRLPAVYCTYILLKRYQAMLVAGFQAVMALNGRKLISFCWKLSRSFTKQVESL